MVLSDTAAADLYCTLNEAGIRLWIIGGWGVDALLGQVTREHKDLDILVEVVDLPLLSSTLRDLGFTRSFEWDENQPVTIDGATFDTAFVDEDSTGRMLDVHAVRVDGDGVPDWAYRGRLALPVGALHATGTLAGRPVRCASAAAQVSMHCGYDAPAEQLADRARLIEFLDEGVDAGFGDPVLAALYDPLEDDRPDLEVYRALIADVGASSVLDVGCGTGELAVRLAGDGLNVIGLDPASASLAIAGRKPDSDKVRWIHGTSAALASTVPTGSVDLAVMTGNVAQVFVTDESWQQTLTHLARVLRPGGRLVFETRRPEARAWLNWTRENSESRQQVDGIGEVHSWFEVTSAELPLVSFTSTSHLNGQTHHSSSTLHFRDRQSLDSSLSRAGFTVDEIREAPDRPGLEWVYLATRAQPVSISRAGESDWRQYRDIRLTMLREAPRAFGTTLAEAEIRTDDDWQHLVRTGRIWLARQGDTCIGSVSSYDDPAVTAVASLLVGMWVNPDARGRGVAEALIETVIADARSRGKCAVLLDVADENERAAAVYRRMGFVAIGPSQGMPWDESVTETRMAFHLPAG